jgi:hypothetical protein
VPGRLSGGHARASEELPYLAAVCIQYYSRHGHINLTTRRAAVRKLRNSGTHTEEILNNARTAVHHPVMW